MTRTRSRMAIAALALGGLLSLACPSARFDWLMLTPSAAQQERVEPAGVDVASAAPVPAPRGQVSGVPLPVRLAAADTREAIHTASALRAPVPHPISADHARLYLDMDLLSAAERAIKDAHYEEARALLEEHHRALPGMSDVEEEGLLLLADCVEEPSEQNVAVVRAFYDLHTDSTIRRSLRRACLEPAQ